jgi:hypothetical protein
MTKQCLLLVFKDFTFDEITTYQSDGVVLLPGLFDLEWIDLLDKGLIANCANPTDRSRVWDRDAEGRTMFWDSQAWLGIDEYRKFIFDSPAAQIAGLSTSTSMQYLCAPRAASLLRPGTRTSLTGL